MTSLRELRILGLGHEDFFVRGFFLSYFDEASDSDPTVSKAVIAALEKYGLQEAFEFPHKLRSLGHDEDTLRWLAQLSEDNPFSIDDSFAPHLIEWFSEAPIALLKQYYREFENSPWHDSRWAHGGNNNAKRRAMFRIEASEWPEEECLSRLDEIADACMELEGFPSHKVAQAQHVCEVLAQQSDLCPGLVSEWLDFDFESDFDRRHWLMGFAIELCSLLKLDSNSGRLVEMMSYDWDWWNESVEKTLVRMQSVDAWNAAVEGFEHQEDHTRLFLSSCLETIQVDGGEPRVTEILNAEEDWLIEGNLAFALANYNSETGLERAREVYLKAPENPEYFQIVHALYAYRRLKGEESDELEHWSHLLHEEYTAAQQTMKRMSTQAIPPKISVVRDAKVGRNDPCPCGSGKKYKKCCIE